MSRKIARALKTRHDPPLVIRGAALAKVSVHIKHISWRDGRPRFTPGPKLRALGFRGEDLKGPDGGWLGLEATRLWVDQKLAEIAARRDGAPKPARRPARGIVYTVEDMFDDLWKAQRFRADGEAGRLAPKTIAEYRKSALALQKFDPEFFTAPAVAIKRGIVKGLHEALWEAKGLVMANRMIAVLRLCFTHAVDYERLAINPCLKLRLPPEGERLRVGTPAEIEALIAAADAGGDADIADAIVLALYTGQRQGDVLALEERNEEGGKIRFVQGKTGARVRVRALLPLVERLAAIRARKLADGHAQVASVVVNRATGAAFVPDTFRHRFAQVRSRAAIACSSVASLWFADLRDTAVTRLALAGCTIPEIAAITGHSLETIHTIMRHYLQLDEAMADAAMDKLAAWLEREGVRL